MIFQYYKHTETGPRNENQDFHEVMQLDKILIACIADGVGGSNCGEVASKETVFNFISEYKSGERNLHSIVESTHRKIMSMQISRKECSGMASTFTGCVIDGNILRGVHVGDTKLCVLRGNGIRQLTDSHTEANRLVKSGKIRFEDIATYPRKHIIESAIGIKSLLTIQEFQFELENNDRVLLTSDGVHDVISKMEFRDLSHLSSSIEDFGQMIVKSIEKKKLTDNATFIAIHVKSLEL